MHRYQRADSIWANIYHTSLEDYQAGFESDRAESFPAYVRYDCTTDSYARIDPPERPIVIRQPEEFGDYWDEALGTNDVAIATEYFCTIEHLSTFLGFINLRVGGKDNVIKIGGDRHYGRGVTFEAPRKSLMTSIQYRIFDDMLIGNFMKTTLHGEWARHACTRTSRPSLRSTAITA